MYEEKDCFRTWIEISKKALHRNIQVIKKRAPQASLIAVVKANAYGHSIKIVASALQEEVSYFAVASLEEALKLREIVPLMPIFLLSAALPCEYRLLAQKGFIPTISSYEEAALFAQRAPVGAPILFKINTGMGRLGMNALEATTTLTRILQLPLTVHSIATHLPSADTNSTVTHAQLTFFKELAFSLKKQAPTALIQVLNSAGLLGYASEAYDAVRVGLLLYGISPMPTQEKELVPALTWKATVAFITKLPQGSTISYGGTYQAPRDIIIAVLPVGYADGYPRQVSGNQADVLLHGKRAPLLGRVTMDQIMVDVTDIPDVQIGDEAVLLGKQGEEEIAVTTLASKAGTISWHLFTGITERVHRIAVA